MPSALENESDESLMRLLQERNHRAFSVLVKRHSDMFYRAAYRMIMNQQDAEDAVQSSFLKLWDRPKIWKEGKGAKFTTWFYRIVINQCQDQMRKRKNNVGDDVLDYMDDGSGDGEQHYTNKQEQEALEQAIRELPEKQKIALNLCVYEGLKQKEAADIMGIRLKALESLLSRAKSKLKDDFIRQGLIEGGQYE